MQKYKFSSNKTRKQTKKLNFCAIVVQTDTGMRIFTIFVVSNVRNGAVEADGKPARAKLKVNRSREARKHQTQGETIRGKSENENLR